MVALVLVMGGTPAPPGADGVGAEVDTLNLQRVHAAPRGGGCALPHLAQTWRRGCCVRAHLLGQGLCSQVPFWYP